MLRFIWSSICLLIAFSGRVCASDTAAVTTPLFRGLYVDADVIEPLTSIASNKHKGYNASLSVNLKDAIYPAVTVGYSYFDASNDYACYYEQPDNYTYNVKGPYFKVGVNFNFIKSKDEFKPVCYLGARYAFSPFKFELKNVLVHQHGWDGSNVIDCIDNTYAQWGEFVGGIKVPVLKRFNLGFEGFYKWGFHPKAYIFKNINGVKTLVNQSYAPGFGDSNGVKWGFRYMIGVFL